MWDGYGYYRYGFEYYGHTMSEAEAPLGRPGVGGAIAPLRTRGFPTCGGVMPRRG
jgi:hypothetical protein